MYFDYDAYNLEKLMRADNNFSAIDIYPMEYEFIEDQISKSNIFLAGLVNIICVLYFSYVL